MNRQPGELLLVAAARLRDRADDLVARQMDVLRKLRSYDQVPDDDLRRSCLRNVMRVVATLEQQDRLPPEIEEDERTSGQRRALQGVSSDDVVEAYRAVLAVLRDAFIDEATAAGARPDDVLAGTRRLWDLTDRYSNVLVSARQQVEIDAARRDERLRIEFLQRLLAGAVDPVELREGGAIHGVLPNRSYWVLRGRPARGGTERLARHLESSLPGPRPLVAPLDGDIAGVSATRPNPLDDAVIAVAGPTTLANLPHAFAEATRVLTVAVRYGRTGVVDSSTLSVRIAVEHHAELGEQLFRRYIGTVQEHGGAADELLHTVQAYFRHGRSVPRTARALSLHENSVRYRLDRFQKITGADFSEIDTLVEVWWALEYATIRGNATTIT